MTSCSSRTPTVPKSIPTGTVRAKRFLTCFGRAAVARSQSRWGCPSIASRTAPPTHHVSNPAFSSVLAILRTAGGGLSLEINSAVPEHRAQLVGAHAGTKAEHEIDSRLLCAARSTKYHTHLFEASSASRVTVGVANSAALSARHHDNRLALGYPSLNTGTVSYTH